VGTGQDKTRQGKAITRQDKAWESQEQKKQGKPITRLGKTINRKTGQDRPNKARHAETRKK
jgi:hypothetical protein